MSELQTGYILNRIKNFVFAVSYDGAFLHSQKQKLRFYRLEFFQNSKASWYKNFIKIRRFVVLGLVCLALCNATTLFAAVGDIGIWRDSVGGQIPETSYSGVMNFATEERNDGAYSFTGGNTLEVLEPGNYLVIGTLKYTDSSNGRVNYEARFGHTGAGDLVNLYGSSFSRNTANNTAWVRTVGLVWGAEVNDTIQLQPQRDTDTPIGGSVADASYFQVVRLHDTAAVGMYEDTSDTGAYGISTWADAPFNNIVLENDTSVIQRQAGNADIQLKKDGTTFLVGYGMAFGTGGDRTQRVTKMVAGATDIPQSFSYAYSRNTANEYASPNGLFLYRNSGTATNLSVQAQLGNADVAGSLVRRVNTSGLFVVEIPASAESFISHDSTGNQDVSGTTGYLNGMEVVDHSDAASFTKVNNTTVNSEKAMDVLLLSQAYVDRTTSSGVRATTGLRYEIQGVDQTLGEHGNYLRGDQATTDTRNMSLSASGIYGVASGDDIQLEWFDGGDDGGVDVTQANAVGFSALNIGSLQNLPPSVPTLNDVPFDNERTGDVTPDFEFTGNDGDGTADIVYQIQVDDDMAFASPLINCESGTTCVSGAGVFINTVAGGDASPFTDGEMVRFTPSTILVNNTTYWWRVRAMDESASGGSGNYGDWSTEISFTVDTTGSGVSWYQTMASQFERGVLSGVIANVGNFVGLRVEQEQEILATEPQGTWGTGTTVPDDPFNVYYHDSRGQSLYLASELIAAGLSAGEITALSVLPFEITTRPDLSQFRVRIKQTLATSMTEWEGGWTDVYGPVDVATSGLTSGVWEEFTFTTPFVWDGVSNIVIDMSRDDNGYTTDGGLYVRTGLTTGRTVSGYCDSCSPEIYTRTTTGTGDNMATQDFVPALRLRTAGATTGTIMSSPIDYSSNALAEGWKEFDWSEDETDGNVSMQLYYASGGGDCDTIVPDGALPGNSGGFTAGPVDISGLSVTTYDKICLRSTLNDVGGSPLLNDWTVRWVSGTSLTQNDYRWYANYNSLQPGMARAAENTFTTGVSTNDILRLRMNTLVSDSDFLLMSEQFKLQYAEGANCSVLTNWIDVDIAAGPGIWRGYNNGIPVNGSTLTNGGYLLSTSDVAQSYQEYNNSPLNPRSTAVGYEAEWDWVIQDNGASAGSSYCFRMVKSSGTPLLYGSDSYPRLITEGAFVEQLHYHWRNDDGSESTATSLAMGNEDTIVGLPKAVTKRIRFGISNNGSVVSPDMFYRLEYGVKGGGNCSDIVMWADVGGVGGDWDMSNSVYLSESQNTSNIANSIGGVSDTNTIFVSNNQGVRDLTSQTAAISLETNEFTEVEYAIEAASGVADGTDYCFRLTDGGTEIGNYAVYAEASIGSVNAYIGKTMDGWGGVIPVYAELGGNLNPSYYQYVRAEVVTPAPESEVYYTDMVWDSGDNRFEGEIRIGSWHCAGCVHPRAGSFDVTVQVDDDAGYNSVDFSEVTGNFTTFITRRRSSLDNTDLTDYNPVWSVDHWAYTIKDLGIYQASGVSQSNVAVAIPFHPITSAITNIVVTYGGVVVSQGDSTSTTDAWWWDSLTHTLYLLVASMPVSDNDTNLLDVDITFDSDTDLWVSRYDHLETTDMGERLFYNGLMISNKNYATFVFGGAGDYGNPNWEGSGEQAESRVHEPGQDDDTMDAMERVAVHVNNNVVGDGSGYYEYNIKWKQDQWKDFIISENNNQVVVVVDSDDTPVTGWVHQIDPNEQVAVKRRQAFTAGKRSIANTYEITNNHPTLTHDLPLVWQREQWLSIKAGSEREVNDRARFSGDTVDRTMEQRVQINTLPEAWMAAYDDAQFVALSIIFNLDDIDGSTYGIFAVEEILGQSAAEWPINITNPHADQWAHQTAFEHTFTGVAPGEMVKFRFAQFIADEESWIDIQDGVEAEFDELNGAQPTFAQRDYRWYKDNDLVNPVEPMGVVGLLENEDVDLLATDGAPNQGDEIRLRMNLNVNTADMNFGRNSFILQYKEGIDDNCITGTWANVGIGEDWTFAESSIGDGSDISSLLASSVVAGQYAKTNPTAVTSNDALLGDVLEYDFHLRATDVNPMSSYSFRAINDDTSLLDDGYLNCPTLKTSPHTEDDMRHGLFFLPSGIEEFFFWLD